MVVLRLAAVHLRDLFVVCFCMVSLLLLLWLAFSLLIPSVQSFGLLNFQQYFVQLIMFFLDLGPQVIYPNGRPCPKREPERDRDRDRRERDRRRDPSPHRKERRDSSRKQNNRSEKGTKSKDDEKKSKK